MIHLLIQMLCACNPQTAGTLVGRCCIFEIRIFLFFFFFIEGDAADQALLHTNITSLWFAKTDNGKDTVEKSPCPLMTHHVFHAVANITGTLIIILHAQWHVVLFNAGQTLIFSINIWWNMPECKDNILWFAFIFILHCFMFVFFKIRRKCMERTKDGWLWKPCGLSINENVSI